MRTAAIVAATGLPGRHLDPWLMPPDILRTLFARSAGRADLAVVEGTLEEARPVILLDRQHQDRPGELAPIAEALDLPRVALVPCPALSGLHLPELPRDVEGIVLDGIERAEEYETIKRVVELVTRRPVLGAVEALPAARAALLDLPRDRPPPRELLATLAASFLRFADLPALSALAESRPFADVEAPPWPRGTRRFRVAYAQDEAFGGYFPDTLETLEALGAELVEFSPLRDGELPGGVDLVIVGCGFPDRFADALARNVCMISQLGQHVCNGNRIYAEGGGTAYLGRQMIIDGRAVRGAGILPFEAELRVEPTGPTPVDRTLNRASWIGPKGTSVRGYRTGRWRLRPAPEPGDGHAISGPLTSQGDVYFRHHAVGSLVHLHLAALPQVVASFAGPHLASLNLPSASGVFGAIQGDG
jgi:cobyrinic acid a,c-diamide synthase